MKKVHRRGGLDANINRHLSEITIDLLTPHVAQELLTNEVSRLFQVLDTLELVKYCPEFI